MKVIFHTLGCKVNQYETESMREQLSRLQYECVPDGYKGTDIDFVVINSCTVTAESDRKTRQTVRKFKRNYPDASIVLCGCLPAAFPAIADELPEADIIFNNAGDGKLTDIFEEYNRTKKRIIEIDIHKDGEKYKTPEICNFNERTRAFMKIEDGCDRFCSYCIIPTARGRVRSRDIDSITKEAKSLAEKGFREIVLVGINLSAYGKDNGLNLCDAVDAVASISGIERIRLGSLEPDHITDKMLERLGNQKKFCPQFHLSLQSGSDATLKRMNRKYDSAFYYDLIRRIRRIFNNASVTTDIMVGFAGETEEEFGQSLKFAKKVCFAKAHVFSYSRRAGTFAYNMPCQVPNSIKCERSQKMIEACFECEKKFIDTQIGLVCPVLFETKQGGFYEGYTENYTRVRVKSDIPLSGMIIPVKLQKRENDYVLGILE